jgi:hypothetical protein
MSKRRRVLIASIAAAMIQVAFFIGYYLLTDGCFCATLDSEPPVPRSPALPGFLNAVDLVGLLGIPGQVGDLPSLVQRLVLNFLAWAILLSLALTGGTYILKRFRRS